MGIVFVLLLALWVTKPIHGIHTATVAWMGVLALLLTGTEQWDDIIGNKKAWDTMIWLGGLLTMANMLKVYGFIGWFAVNIGDLVMGIEGMALLVIIALIYFYSMYLFSMLTAHIAAMVGLFFALLLTTNVPPLVTIALIAYFSNLCGCLTNYSTGPVVIYFGLGYVEPARWFRIGFLVSLLHLTIWLGVLKDRLQYRSYLLSSHSSASPPALRMSSAHGRRASCSRSRRRSSSRPPTACR